MVEKNITFGKQTFVGRMNGDLEDKYDILEEIGIGGYSRVLKIQNIETGKLYACKELQKNELADIDSFNREIDILIKLDHPNIIKLYEVYENEDFIYIVMELCNGGELFDRIIKRTEMGNPFTEKEAATIFKQLMSAVSYCHSNKIVHRDLKPDNLLLLNNGDDTHIKIIDFGTSLIFKKKNTSMFDRVGTAYYISPEVIDGYYDEKCDVWSCGIILYILLCGYPPFNGRDDEEIFLNIRRLNYSFPSPEWNNISNDAKDLLKSIICDQFMRLNDEQVLNHIWLKNLAPNAKEGEKIQININSFKNYSSSNKLKKAVLTFIASRLSEEEVKKLKENFQKIDTNGDGMLSLEEVKKAISHNKGISLSNVEQIFKSIDTDNSGNIDYTEFIAASLDKNIYLQENKLYEAFKLFDVDGSGKISKDEIAYILGTEKKSKEIEKLFKKYDTNNDGEIDFKEFVNMMKEEF
jgi:calcium-dependent protein kinase